MSSDPGGRRGGSLEGLSAALRAVSPPNRLELLARLQLPHTLQEIEMHAFRRDRARSPERPLSRRAIETHLEQLRELGLVRARATTRDGQRLTEYVVNRAGLFVLVDDFRRAVAPPGGLQSEATAEDARPGPGAALPADRPVVLVANGPHEGTVFALDGPGPWTVGRDRGLAVALPYDPFVSKQNTRLWREGGALRLATLPGARNGTSVNWRRLAPEEATGVVAGDLIGVGRSLLVLRGG